VRGCAIEDGATGGREEQRGSRGAPQYTQEAEEEEMKVGLMIALEFKSRPAPIIWKKFDFRNRTRNGRIFTIPQLTNFVS
jgi:hypothetical protein